MKSRMEKYDTQRPTYKRTTKNASLYKEIYGNYAGLENLPIADNTNEINMKDLQEIVNSSERRNARKIEYNKEEWNIERKQEEQREYDINKILENAKNNRRPKEEKKVISPTYKFLTTLESQEIPVPEIKKAQYSQEEEEIISQEKKEIYMTREFKFRNRQLEVAKEINDIDNSNSSPLDLFQNLKPDENSFISEPVKLDKDSIFSTSETPEQQQRKPQIKEIIAKENAETNTSPEDIDIIKKEAFKNNTEIDSDFYTNSYKFSKKDFIDDDDFSEKDKKGYGVLKIILLILAIFALTTMIYYFISNYGMGV